MKPRARGDRLWHLVTNNLLLKIVALVVSIVLFSLVHSDQDAQRTIPVDVVAVLPPPGSPHMLISALPEQVKLTLRGSRSRLASVQRDDFPPLQMDLTDPSKRYYYFDPGSVEVSGTLQVAEISPSSVPLTWALSEERSIPVRARLRGAPGEALAIKQPVTVSPSSVTVRGPQDTVRAIQAAYTEVIQVEGFGAGSHERRVRLEPLPEYTNYLENMEVDAVLEVVPELVEKTFRRIDVAWVGEGDAQLRPDRVAVTLRGTTRRLAELESDHLIPYVELGAADAGMGTRPQMVKMRGIPDGLELVRIVPKSVLVRRRR